GHSAGFCASPSGSMPFSTLRYLLCSPIWWIAAAPEAIDKSTLSANPSPLVLLHRENSAEKRPIALQSKTEVLGRDIVAAIPLALESRPFRCEHLSQALHGHG